MLIPTPDVGKRMALVLVAAVIVISFTVGLCMIAIPDPKIVLVSRDYVCVEDNNDEVTAYVEFDLDNCKEDGIRLPRVGLTGNDQNRFIVFEVHPYVGKYADGMGNAASHHRQSDVGRGKGGVFFANAGLPCAA